MMAPIQPKAVEGNIDDATALPIESLETFPTQSADSLATAPAAETKTAETPVVEAEAKAADEPAPQNQVMRSISAKPIRAKKSSVFLFRVVTIAAMLRKNWPK
jgi:hypothetical protein